MVFGDPERETRGEMVKTYPEGMLNLMTGQA